MGKVRLEDVKPGELFQQYAEGDTYIKTAETPVLHSTGTPSLKGYFVFNMGTGQHFTVKGSVYVIPVKLATPPDIKGTSEHVVWQPRRFWMCYVNDAEAPKKQHFTRDEAKIEAERLARETGKVVYLLGAVEYVEPLPLAWKVTKSD